MAENYVVQTPENVAVSYDLAGIGSRFIAAAVDSIIQVALIVLVTLAISVAGGVAATSRPLRDLSASDPNRVGVWIVAVLLVALFLLLWGYYAAFEMAWNGQTPGKRLTRLRVLRDSGYPIGPIDALIRNLVRLVDFLPMAYGLGVVVMLIDKRSRRLGDLAAGTMVVKERRALRAADLLAPRPLPIAPDRAEASMHVPNVDRLTAADYTLLREYLLRREQLAPAPRAALARELAEALASRLDAPSPQGGREADEFLAGVALAYRARQRAGAS
ncbi:MAG TPA: RDD family protein [Chloroflexota bacterium]|nr:RDD family protein [Chloroflexota bacterium]